MNPAKRSAELLAEAYAYLAARDCGMALTEYDRAEYAGADRDRCAGGRWMSHMLLGEYERAWRESDAIRERDAPDPHRFWNGEPIDGKRVMLRCLHGYGDTVMYLRWLPELRRRAREVIVQCCPEMLPVVVAMIPTRDEPAGLLSKANADRRRTSQAPIRMKTWSNPGESDDAEWDVQVESAELPYLFRATPATLPVPALLYFAGLESSRVRIRLGPPVRPRVGLVWTGSNYDPARSIAFEELRPLLSEHAVEFWSLQAPGNNEEWDRFCAERGWGARTFYTRETADDDYFDNTIVDMAAFASELDLVITIDTLAAHVAGSLNVPTWVLLKWEADWRWMLEREDSPWYPSVRLFRQSVSGDWDAPLARVRQSLQAFVKKRGA